MLVGSIILAGGRSRRMGRPKEALPFGGGTLLGNVTELLLDCTWPVVVVSREPAQELPPLPLEVVLLHDDHPGSGPLAAMRTGMYYLRGGGELGEQDAVFVTGCDAPFLTSRAVGWLSEQLGDHQAVMPRTGGGTGGGTGGAAGGQTGGQTGGTLQPLCAIYRLSCLPTVEQLLASGVATPRTLAEQVRTRVLEEVELRAFDPELRFLTSLNTPEEYDAACKLAGS